MASCYQCGKRLQPNTGVRRQVTTGETLGTISGPGGRPHLIESRTVGFRIVCPECAASMDRRATVVSLCSLVTFLVTAIGSLYVYFTLIRR